jgi:probable phosphoglycerate mutase
MTLYIIRHGETQLNRQGEIQGSGVDAPLNETGHQQAAAFFKTYQHIDFQLVVTSRLQRTQQTVQSFIDLDIPWIVSGDIDEISWGDHEGKKPSPSLNAQFQQLIQDWTAGRLDAALPNGESAAQLAVRLGRFIQWLKTRPEERILVATHGRTLRCFMSMLKGLGAMGMEGSPHANTGLYIVHFQEDSVIFEAENSISHLTENGWVLEGWTVSPGK